MSTFSLRTESDLIAPLPIAKVSQDDEYKSWSNAQILQINSNPSVADSDTLLNTPREPFPKTITLRRHLYGKVRIDFLAEIELAILTICIGMQDAVSFPDYHCFASNQTGNTIFLTLSAVQAKVGDSLFYIPNVAVSLGFFLLGAWVTGQLSHKVGCRSRPWIVLTSLLQTLMVFGAAGLQFRYGVQHPRDLTGLGVPALLAFSAGSQVVLSRSFRLPEISTAMATAAWVDLLIDPQLLNLRNKPRDRRVLFLVALVIGGFVGAGIYRYHGSRWSILISGMGKLFVTFLFLFNSTERETIDEEKL